MKINNFKPKPADSQARYLAKLLPRGRAWNSQSGTILYKTIQSLSAGLGELYNLIWQLINEFRIDTSISFLEKWEESLGIIPDESLSISERRANIKAQVRKVPVITVEEWEQQIEKALGMPVSVYPGAEIDLTDEFFLFPYTFPIYFYPVHPSRKQQNRFVVYVDGELGATQKIINIVEKFKPSNVWVVYVRR